VADNEEMYPLSSAVRILHKKCPDCGERHLIDPSILNDRAETVEGYVQQSWCPGCGLMAPNLREDENCIKDNETISRGAKKKVAMKIGRSHGFDSRLCRKIVEEELRDISLKKGFITNLSETYYLFFGTIVSEEEIKSFL
jgi:hypothetical protein